MNTISDQRTVDDLKDMANILRIHSIEMTEVANSGYFFFLSPFSHTS